MYLNSEMRARVRGLTEESEEGLQQDSHHGGRGWEWWQNHRCKKWPLAGPMRAVSCLSVPQRPVGDLVHEECPDAQETGLGMGRRPLLWHGSSRAASVSILELLAEVGLLLLEGSFSCRTRSEYSCVLGASHKCDQWKSFSFFHVYSLLSPSVSP